MENALTQLREVRQMYVTLDERARRQEREKCAGMLKALAWDDSGLCVDPDLDEIADELAAAAAYAAADAYRRPLRRRRSHNATPRMRRPV